MKKSEVENRKGETMINKLTVSFIVLAGVLALAPRVTGQASSQAPPEEVTITGIVTCSKYVYSKPDRKGFTPAEAIRLCASQGYSYVIISGRNVYPLEGDKNKLAKLAGEKVTITGHVDTDQPTNAKYSFHDAIATTTVAPAAK